MEWTADNNGILYIDGIPVQNRTGTFAFQSTSTYQTSLAPGNHIIEIAVEDLNSYSGLYVSGRICPTGETVGTGTNTSTTGNGPGSTTIGTSGEPCPCETTIIGGVAALGAVSALTLLAVLKKK